MNSIGKIRQGVIFPLLMAAFLLLPGMGNVSTAQTLGSLENKTISSYKSDTTEINNLLKEGLLAIDRNFDSAVAIFQNALIKSKAIGYQRGITRSLIQLSKRYLDNANYDASVYYAQQAYAYAIKQPSAINETIKIYDILSKNYFFKGAYPQSAYYSYKACEQLLQSGTRNLSLLTQIYTNLFMCSERMGLGHVATYYLDLAERTIIIANDSSSLAILYTNKAAVYYRKQDWDNAEKYYFKSLDVNSRHEQYSLGFEAVTYTNLAGIYTQKDKPQLTVDYATKALRLNQNTHNVRNEIDAYAMLGYGYFQLENYKKAEQSLHHALELAKPIGYFDNLVNTYEILIRIYAGSGKYEDAFKYYRIKNKIVDSLLNIRKFKTLSELEEKYKSAEKDKHLAENKLLIVSQENELRKKNMWIGGISLGVLFLITLSIAIYRSNKQKERLQQGKIDRLQQEQHIQKLEATIKGEEKERARMARELHDGIVGQLASVKWNLNAARKEYDVLDYLPYFQDAVNQLDEATNELRNTAHNLLPGIIVEQGLIEAVAHFCKKVSKSYKLTLDFHSSGKLPDLSADFKLSVYRMIQELVQNVIKHSQATQALVQIDYRDTLLVVTVEDNGVGFDVTKMQSQGIGLKNIPERAGALNGQYHLESNEDGTSVHLEFDIATLKSH